VRRDCGRLASCICDELCAERRQELLDGEVIWLPPAMYDQSEIGRAFQKLLETALDESRVRFFEGYQLRRGWLISYVSATWPGQPVSGWLQGDPTIAIEIVSRGNNAAEVHRKVNAYLLPA
jgi:hypothetical protein